jgi:hypothetical protein
MGLCLGNGVLSQVGYWSSVPKLGWSKFVVKEVFD